MTVEILDLSDRTADLVTGADPDLFDHAVDQQALRRFMDDPLHLMKLAVAEGKAVGFASGTVLLHPDKKPQLFINEVEVLPAWRRQGIGRRLVAAVVEAGRAQGCDYAWLGTEADNAGGNACFRSVPGVERGETFVLYEWELEA